MPYEGEFASYRPLQRMAESARVRELLKRAKTYKSPASTPTTVPRPAPECKDGLPRFVLAIDGSHAEVDVVTGYPGAKVGYCTVASVLIDLDLMTKLDSHRPTDPRLLRDTEFADAIDAALPGTNVVTRRRTSALESFREELYDHFASTVIDIEDKTSLLDTYEVLLAHKPSLHAQQCPYSED